QMAFLSLLRQPSTPTVVSRPVDVQVMEIPVTARAPATQPTPPARRSPTPPKPRVEPPAPRPAPPPPQARVEAPRDPTPAVEAEPAPAAPSAPTTGGGADAAARRALGARDRPGPTQHRLPGRDDRPTDAGPGRRGAARPRSAGAAERNGPQERSRDLQANAGNSRLAPPPDGGPGRGRAVPSHRRWQRPGRADSADRWSGSPPGPGLRALAVAVLCRDVVGSS